MKNGIEQLTVNKIHDDSNFRGYWNKDDDDVLRSGKHQLILKEKTFELIKQLEVSGHVEYD